MSLNLNLNKFAAKFAASSGVFIAVCIIALERFSTVLRISKIVSLPFSTPRTPVSYWSTELVPSGWVVATAILAAVLTGIAVYVYTTVTFDNDDTGSSAPLAEAEA